MSAAPQITASDSACHLKTGELMGPRYASGPRVVDDRRRILVVGGLPVATLGPDPSRINPLCARSAAGMPVIEMLAAIASQDPTGVLAIESADEKRGFAFNVHRGKVVSAKGPGELGQLEPWCAAVHQRFPERFDCAPDADDRRADPSWIRVAKTFVGERALDHLELALAPGSQLTFIRGDVEWIGTSMVHDRSPSLSHLLLEHARRSDERPRLLDQLGALNQVVVPLSEPGGNPTTPGAKEAATDGDDDWDFFDDPDPAALQEWDDAKALWPLCDGQHSIEEVIEFSMLGRFRALAAVAALASRQHVLIAKTRRPPRIAEDAKAAKSSSAAVRAPIVAPVVDLHTGVTQEFDGETGDSPAPTGPASKSPPPALGAPKPANTGYSMKSSSKELARVSMKSRARRAQSPVQRKAGIFPALGTTPQSARTSASTPVPEAEEAVPTATGRISSAAIATVAAAKRDPNFRAIALALGAALIFVAGAAAAVFVSQSLAAKPAGPPVADSRD